MAGKIRAYVACQIDACAMENSYPLDMVRMLNGKPICQDCYDERGNSQPLTDWHNLPAIELSDLCE